MLHYQVRSVRCLLEEGEGGSVTEEGEEENEEENEEDKPASVVEVEDGEGSAIVGEGEGGSEKRQGPVGGPPMNLTSPM